MVERQEIQRILLVMGGKFLQNTKWGKLEIKMYIQQLMKKIMGEKLKMFILSHIILFL